jgi:hypothetical protein
MAKIERLRPATHHKAADAIQTVLDLGLPLAPETKADLLSTYTTYRPEPWPFVMMNIESARFLLQRIRAGKDSGLTLAVWIACLTFAEYGTGRITATRQKLAETVRTTPDEVSRALGRLAGMGVLERTGPGRYQINPATAWHGTLEARRQAGTASMPARDAGRRLEPIEGGKGRARRVLAE